MRSSPNAECRKQSAATTGGHDGGKDIWMLPDMAKLLMSWKTQPDALTEETALIAKLVAPTTLNIPQSGLPQRGTLKQIVHPVMPIGQ